MPRVSVIITTHNRPGLLPRAVESARNSATDVEVVVVDDASRDETAAVCRELRGIRYIRTERNQGVAGARNLGIAASSGEYISFHDDDDLRFPESIDRQCAFLEQNPKAGLCYAPIFLGDQECRSIGHTEPKQLPSGDLFWTLLAWNFIICLSVVFRRECLDRVGLLDPGATAFDDWDLWVRIAELYEVEVCPEPVGIWRMSIPHSGQGSSAPARNILRSTRHQHKLLALPRAAEDPARRRAARRRRLEMASDWLVWNAATWIREGAFAYARQNLLTAFRLHPARTARPWTVALLLSTVRIGRQA